MDAARTALLTGVTSGIGYASAASLTGRGVRVVGTSRSKERAGEVQERAAADGFELEVQVLDLGDEEACAEVVRRVRPDVLVNNAGYVEAGPVEDVDDDEAQSQLDVLVLAPMRLIRLVIPEMRARGWGRIVNVSSILGEMVLPYMGWYAAGKHAMDALSQALRLELSGTGIDVVLIEPGAIRTAIWDKARDHLDEEHDGAGGAHSEAEARWHRLTGRLQPLFTDPAAVGRTVASAATASRPRRRYYVGFGAWLPRAYDVTPAPVRELVLRRSLGIGS